MTDTRRLVTREVGEFRTDRERIHAEVANQRREEAATTDFFRIYWRDVDYLLGIADVVAQVARCRRTFGDKPAGYTCLDQLSEAADMKSKYGQQFRAEILNGDHLCDGCQLRAALAEY